MYILSGLTSRMSRKKIQTLDLIWSGLDPYGKVIVPEPRASACGISRSPHLSPPSPFVVQHGKEVVQGMCQQILQLEMRSWMVMYMLATVYRDDGNNRNNIF